MVHFAIAAMLQTSVLFTGANPSYEKAYNEATENNRPLVVLVGTEWCPGCMSMKHSVMPQIKQNGTLQNVEFVQVNCDSEPNLAEKLMQGRSIPQLIMYRRTRFGWKREQLTGAHSVTEVEQFIKRADADKESKDSAVRIVSQRSE